MSQTQESPPGDVIERFQSTFNALTSTSLGLLEDLYAEEIRFVDPVHEIRGLPALRDYFRGLYEGVVSCRFDFHEVVPGAGQGALSWTMHLEHERFQRGRVVQVDGASMIRFTDRVNYHRDYFDLGQFVYERVPLLGAVVRRIKARLAAPTPDGAAS